MTLLIEVGVNWNGFTVFIDSRSTLSLAGIVRVMAEQNMQVVKEDFIAYSFTYSKWSNVRNGLQISSESNSFNELND